MMKDGNIPMILRMSFIQKIRSLTMPEEENGLEDAQNFKELIKIKYFFNNNPIFINL